MPLVMKWVVEDLTPFTAFYYRLVVAIVAVIVLRLIMRSPPLRFATNWRLYFWASIGIVPSGPLAYWSAQYLPSGVYAVVYGLMPFFVLPIALLVGTNAVINRVRWCSLVIAFLGLVGLSYSQLQGGFVQLPGLFICVVSAQIFALSIVMVGVTTDERVSVLNLINGSLIFALVFLTPLLPVLDIKLHIQPALSGVLGIIYLGAIGSVFSYIAYYYLLAHISPVSVSILFLISPLLAVLIGAGLNAEHYGVIDVMSIGVMTLSLAAYSLVTRE